MGWGTGQVFVPGLKQETEEKRKLVIIFRQLFLKGVTVKVNGVATEIKNWDAKHALLKEHVEQHGSKNISLAGMGKGNLRIWMNGPSEQWPEKKRVKNHIRFAFISFIEATAEEYNITF